jgi:hypothetical protein
VHAQVYRQVEGDTQCQYHDQLVERLVLRGAVEGQLVRVSKNCMPVSDFRKYPTCLSNTVTCGRESSRLLLWMPVLETSIYLGRLGCFSCNHEGRQTATLLVEGSDVLLLALQDGLHQAVHDLLTGKHQDLRRFLNNFDNEGGTGTVDMADHTTSSGVLTRSKRTNFGH